MTAADHPGIVGTPSPPSLTLAWADEDATQAFALRLAGAAELRHAFIALHGDLGAGKTTFVRHLLRALGIEGRIKSPTYAVVEPHQVSGPDGAWPVSHFDFYRFDDPREWEDAGFRDIFAAEGLKLAEWPEKAAGVLPVPDLDIALTSQADETRSVTLTANTRLGEALLRHAEAARTSE
ncbi:tRNA (adenosine(37)-N6)-threonylcarbamoyltransferase complex ATPase subunit type 1 TsaE [Xylophilus rhododendri]|uniref:tRNA (adenosine(37)-N6)-threonylcarbamoyltransferase complex ATPase subunit type 1 TsaE n=1 Tax=Xylophilus rhododendri TaxID=2697032 RepID=UPI001E3239D3|nr:tRNA (adenosine(37)-N6)-threonylcarbamoyltransferase complex ATPase subunit type 1 TsaE [Xylophilus rhododendri]